MAKQLTVPYGGKNYTLELNRRAIMSIEANGVMFKDAEHMPLSSVFDLFRASFLMHHRDVDEDTIYAIFEEQDFEGLSEDLVAMLDDVMRSTTKGETKRKRNW